MSDRRAATIGFWVSFLFALATSGALAVERLERGAFPAWLLGIAITFAAALLATAASAFPRRRGAVVRAQLGGAILAMALVHVVLLTVPQARARLVEGPAQWVNDAVLALGILALAWSFAVERGLLRFFLPVVALGLAFGYSATAAAWHVDPFAGHAVQRYVVAQIIATGIGLLVLDFARSIRRA